MDTVNDEVRNIHIYPTATTTSWSTTQGVFINKHNACYPDEDCMKCGAETAAGSAHGSPPMLQGNQEAMGQVYSTNVNENTSPLEGNLVDDCTDCTSGNHQSLRDVDDTTGNRNCDSLSDRDLKSLVDSGPTTLLTDNHADPLTEVTQDTAGSGNCEFPGMADINLSTVTGGSLVQQINLSTLYPEPLIIVPINIKAIKYSSLVDTGSSVSFITETAANSLNEPINRNDTCLVRGLDPIPIPTLGVIEVTPVLQDVALEPMKFRVMPDYAIHHPVILGTDFFGVNKLNLDIDKQVISKTCRRELLAFLCCNGSRESFIHGL